MQKQFKCSICQCTDLTVDIEDQYKTLHPDGEVEFFCKDCFMKPVEIKEHVRTPVFNEPEHYHKHKVDTIKFLQEGFPPDVFMAFAIGHVIKYAQRANYKGTTRDDLVKMSDYAKRALDWYDKTNGGEK